MNLYKLKKTDRHFHNLLRTSDPLKDFTIKCNIILATIYFLTGAILFGAAVITTSDYINKVSGISYVHIIPLNILITSMLLVNLGIMLYTKSKIALVKIIKLY